MRGIFGVGGGVLLCFAVALAACEEGPPPRAGGTAPGPDGGRPDAGPSGGPDAADGDAGDAAPRPPPGADAGPPVDCPTFEDDVGPLLAESCALAGCHGGERGQAGLRLDLSAGYDALVGVTSTQRPDRLRVRPGDPDASYLMEKLGPSPSVGRRMPLGLPDGLPASRIELVRRWIAVGAPRTAAEGCETDPPADAPVDAVEIAGERDFSLGVGELRALEATAVDADGNPILAPITWRTDAEERLYVDGAGTLLGLSPGPARVFAGSGGVESRPTVVTVVDASPPAAAFSRDVLPLLRARCGIDGCHVDGGEGGDLRFDRAPGRIYRELREEADEVDGYVRVAPGSLSESYLVLKLTRTDQLAGERMPMGMGPLPAADLAVLVRWILAGAPED